MKQRCYNLNLPAYRWWGGQGIEVCDEWKNDFTKFNDWALANGFKENLTFLTIDRIDPEKDYCPKNCQWIPHIENILKEHRDHENKRFARSQ
jgi:hypothetical protein